MPSSEEIAAALDVAIGACEMLDGRPRLLEPSFAAAAKTLRAHLSRLREEAEFRDAAREIGAYLDELYAPAALEPQMLRLLKAYRALEGR